MWVYFFLNLLVFALAEFVTFAERDEWRRRALLVLSFSSNFVFVFCAGLVEGFVVCGGGLVGLKGRCFLTSFFFVSLFFVFCF